MTASTPMGEAVAGSRLDRLEEMAREGIMTRVGKWLGWAALCLGGVFVVWPLVYNLHFMMLEYVLPDVLTQYAFVGGLMFLASLLVSVGITFIICGALAQRLGLWR